MGLIAHLTANRRSPHSIMGPRHSVEFSTKAAGLSVRDQPRLIRRIMAFLFFIAGVLAIVWGIALLRYGGPLAVGLVTLVSGICFGSPFFQISLITIDRLLVGLLAITYVILRKSDLFECKRLSQWDACLFAFLGALMLSTLLHDWTWDGLKPASRLTFYYLFPAVMYWIGRESVVSERMLRILYVSSAMFGLYLAGTAIAEWQKMYGFVFPKYIASSDMSEFLGRGRGPLLNPSGNGILLCLGLVSLFMIWPRLKYFGRIAFFAATCVYSLGIIATLTRCVWLGAVMGVGTVVLLSFPRRLKFGILISASCLITLFVATNWQELAQFKRDENVSVTEMAQSAKIRPVLVYVAWEMFKDNPIMGVGLGHYKEHDKYYLDRGKTDLNLEIARPYHQHNIFLSLLTETGYIGLQLFILLIAIWSRAAWELWKAPRAPLEVRQLGLVFLVLMFVYVANGMFQDVTIVPMVHMTLFFFAGLTVGQSLKHRTATKALPAKWIQRQTVPA